MQPTDEKPRLKITGFRKVTPAPVTCAPVQGDNPDKPPC